MQIIMQQVLQKWYKWSYVHKEKVRFMWWSSEAWRREDEEMEPFRWARLQPGSGGRGCPRQGDCMTQDAGVGGRQCAQGTRDMQIHLAAARTHSERRTWGLKLGTICRTCLIKLQSGNFISYIMGGHWRLLGV